MGLFDRIFPKKTEQTLKAEQTFKTFEFYRPVFTSWSGKIYESEMVRAAVDARARHISKLKFEIRGTAKPGLRSLVAYNPNSFQTWSQFFYRLSTILDVHNTAFVVPMVNRFGEQTGYYPLLPNRCELVESEGEVYLRYKFDSGRAAAIELDRCAILTRHQLSRDFFGETNEALAPTMGLTHLENEAIKEAIKNGARYRFMATLNNFRSPKDMVEERQEFTELNFKTGNDGFLLFPNTYSNIQQIKDNPFTIDSAERKQIATNIYNYFGVNEKVLQSTALGDDLDAFYEGSIEPFAIQASEALTNMTFSLNERRYGNAIYLTANRLQYMKMSDKISYVKELTDRGLITINEAREALNYVPLDGDEGNRRPARGEYYFVDANGNKTTKEDTKRWQSKITENTERLN